MIGNGQKPWAPSCLRWRGFALLMLGCCLFVFNAGCATQDDLMIIYNRVVLLETQQKEAAAERAEVQKKLDDTLSQWESDALKLREDVAEMRASNESVRNEVRSFYGLLEEQGYQMREKVGSFETTGSRAGEKMAILEARMDSMQDTLLRMEAYLGMEAAAQKEEAAQENEQTPSGELSEAEAYAQAKKAFDEMRLDAARKDFEAFLARFPNSNNADNALFWIGETYFQEKWYEKAILQYQEVIEKHPKANKSPAAYFKQGMAFSLLDDHSNARLIWTELIKKFPDSPEAGFARKKLSQ